jgi:hypothetical protein
VPPEPVTDPAAAARLAALLAPIDHPKPALPDPDRVAPSVPDMAVTKPQPAAQPEALQPTAMKPAAPKRVTKPIAKTKPTRRLEPGDLICPQCGEGNDPVRKFCSRCGESLAIAETHKVKWWQRIFHRKPKSRDHPSKASVKPKRGLSATTVAGARKVLTTVAIVAAFAIALVPNFRSWTNDHVVQPARDKWHAIATKDFAPVHPSGALSTAQTTDNPAGFAIDSAGDTFWVAPASAGEAVLVLAFDQPVNLDKARIQNGARDQFSAFSRAKDLHLVFDTGKTADVTLKDQPDQQNVTIHNGHGVKAVEIHIASTHSAIGNPDVALTEIELFSEK